MCRKLTNNLQRSPINESLPYRIPSLFSSQEEPIILSSDEDIKKSKKSATSEMEIDSVNRPNLPKSDKNKHTKKSII